MSFGQISQMIILSGALVTVLSFSLTVFLKWEDIKRRIKGETRQAKRRAISPSPHYPPSIDETIPSVRVPDVVHPAANSPRLNILNLIDDLFFDLIKTILAIFMAIAISAEYLLIAYYHGPSWLPIEMFLVVSLLLGSIVGAYLRACSSYSIVVIGILSQIGFLLLLILALSGWNLGQVEKMLQAASLKFNVQSLIETAMLAVRPG